MAIVVVVVVARLDIVKSITIHHDSDMGEVLRDESEQLFTQIGLEWV